MTRAPREADNGVTVAPSRVITLLQAVRYAFQQEGPVEEVMGQYRPLQEEAAIALAQYITHRTQQTTITVWMQQQHVGIGKTLAVLVVLSLYKLLGGHSSLIATYTRAMRLSYLKEVERANQIVRQTLDDNGYGHLYREVVISEHQSVTPYLSPTKIATLEARVASRSMPATPQITGLINYYRQAVEHGDVPNFDGYYAQGGTLPPNTDALYWSMCSADRNDPLFQMIIDRNSKAHVADILLATHSMLIRSNIAKGKVLKTASEDVEEAVDTEEPRTGIALIDEADKLAQVAHEALTMGVNHNDIKDLLEEIETHPPGSAQGQQVVERAKTLIERGLVYLTNWMNDRSQPRTLIVDFADPLVEPFVQTLDRIETGFGMILGVMTGRYQDDDRDPLFADRVRAVQAALRSISNIGQRTAPKMGIITFYDPSRRLDLRIVIDVGSGRNLINQLWRTRQSGERAHTFGGIGCISATLTDLPPHEKSYKWFKRSIGFGEDDQSIDLPPLPSNSRRHQYGSIDEVVVASRDWPHPTDDGNPPTMINEHFIGPTAAALTSLAQRQDKMSADSRMLVLFPSFDLIDVIYGAVPDLHERIIRRTKNANLMNDIALYAERPHGIWFGVEWEGVNFIDPNPPMGEPPRTLADILVIPRLPQPPTNQLRRARIADALQPSLGVTVAERRAEAAALHEATGTAYRKMIQGVGRGIRNPHDVIRVLAILDLRFPVPLHVAETRKIARSGGDPTKMFSHFDYMLDPYTPQKWSQIDKTGKITRIL